ncbi:hypothetical protein QTP88_029287 [Uroleucon formosanum]
MKLFTVAVITMTIVATLTVPNGAVDPRIDLSVIEEMISPIHSKCPPNVTADFEVIFNDGEDSSTVKGCASFEFKSSNDFNEMKIFGFRFGRFNSDGPRVCVPGNYAGMEQLVFSCKSEPASSTLESNSTNVFRLHGHVLKPAGKHQTRCVLSLMLFSPRHAMAPEGSTLLRLSPSKDDLRHRRSTLEDKNSTRLFSGYIIIVITDLLLLQKKGASISCCGAKCPRVFHHPCGLRNGSMHQYFNSYKSFCEKHRTTQTIELSELRKSTSTTCAICTDAVIRSPLPTSIWAPCCKRDALFHRQCIQDLALNAGYFFKCSLCNNVHKFKCRMLDLGIYIPSRDPSWETEPNVFAELSERLIICSVNTCLCPHENTRKYQNPSGSWEILLCNSCGSNGTHRLCNSIIDETEEWVCAICKEVIVMSEEQFASHNQEISQKLHSEMVDDENRPQSLDDRVLGLYSNESNCIVQLPIISSYASTCSGFIRNLFGNRFSFFSNCIDLASDDDDN